jgi:hypothetical protein
LFDSYYTDQSAPAGRFIGARHFTAEPESERPHWKDVAPRLGAVYDVFGDSTTAVKMSWGKYVGTYRAGFSSAYNPMTQSTDQRTWTDLNGDDIAQGDLSCDTRQAWGTPGCEIGRPANVLFGKTAARAPAPGIKRPYNTETALSVQRQIIPGMSVSLGYARRDYKRMIVTQNLATQPLGAPPATGYTAVSVPNPRDPTLPALTVYNLDPALKGLVNDLDTNSSNNKRWFNAWDVNVQSRVFGGTLFGGASWGQQVLVLCDVRDPNYISTTFGQNGLRFCDQSALDMPFRGQYKVSATYPLPLGISISGTLQSQPGGGATQSGGDSSQNINYNISAAAFRTLTGQTLTQTSVIVRLVEPGTLYLPRLNLMDIRVSKRVQIGKYRLQGQFDAFNVTNANTVTGQTQTFGASYGRVSDIVLGRVFAIGGTLTF